MTDLIKLDLACGQRREDGWTGVDVVKTDATDVVHDLLSFPWPFEDGSVDEARCLHFLEHIPQTCYCCRDQTDPLFRFFDELYRVLAPAGRCQIVTPYYANMRAWQDPTHRRAITEATFLYANRAWREANGLSHYPISCNFGFVYAYDITQDWMVRSEEARLFALRHYQGVASDLHVTLTKEP